MLYRNNLKSWFLTASALPQYFCLHSCLASRQWSLVPYKNIEAPSGQTPNPSSCLGLQIMIAAGGTGGHVFPALSLAKTLQEKGYSPVFLGGGLSKNPYFNSCCFPYREIACSRLSLRSPFSSFRIARGIVEALLAFKQFNPALLVGFGSYYTLPILLAARISGLPYILHEQNGIPGRVNRFFAKKALWTGVYFPGSAQLLKGKTREVEMPLREGFIQPFSKEEALRNYGFSKDLPVLLIFGGSQGARFINEILFNAASQLKGWQVLHFTGNSEWTQKLSWAYSASGLVACVKDFEQEMAKAWKVADLVVSRAGAASIAEQLLSLVPGILIPYPYATDQHQDSNADFMVNTVKGAVKWKEKELSPHILIKHIEELRPRLEEMRTAIRHYKEKRILPAFAEEIIHCL